MRACNGRMQAAERAAATHETIDAALRADDIAEVALALDGLGVDVAASRRLVAAASHDTVAHDRLATLKAELARAGVLTSETVFERSVLLRSARASLGEVPRLPLTRSVKEMFYDEFVLCAAPDARRAPLLELGTSTFRAMCEVVSLARFPAGQLHWNTSGLPRSMLVDVRRRDLAGVLFFVANKMRGFAPAAFTHVNELRRNRFIWLEEESNRSYHRIARSLEHQPESRGLVTRAWFHDPDLGRVSPHLAWTNRVIVENGGIVVRAGTPDLNDVFANNSARRDAYERGSYRPQFGLVLWPRAELIEWARRNPQYADARDREHAA